MPIEMNTLWIGAALVLPLLPALLVAAALWAMQVGDEIGAIAGTVVILAFAVGFAAREYREVEVISQRCIDARVFCRFSPVPFTRYALYGSIGMIQTFFLFTLSLSVEERRRRRR
jgi:hypothetical protein